MNAKLTYFDGRGHGERVRYALAAAGIPYSESLLVKKGDMDAVRGQCLFGQVPLLEIGGVSCIQSWSTVRYIAAVSGMVPKDHALAYRADAVAEQVRDLFTSGNFVGFGWGEKNDDMAKFSAAAASHLPKFEAILGNDAPFVCGKEACWADFQVLYGLNYIEEVIPGSLAPFPYLAKLRGTLNALPRIADFLANQAKGLVTDKYKVEVKEGMSSK